MDCNCVKECVNKSHLKHCALSELTIEELMQAYVLEVYEYGFDHPNPYQYIKEIKKRIKEVEDAAYDRGLNTGDNWDDRYDEGYNDGYTDAGLDYDEGYKLGLEEGKIKED